jgi:hypothetical protein
MQIPKKRKGISAFGLDLTSFPLVVMFFAGLITLGQVATSYQTANPYGISQTFNINPFSLYGKTFTPNLNNVTLSGYFSVSPLQTGKGSQCSVNTLLATWLFPFGAFGAELLYSGCVITTNAVSIVQNILFSATVSSATTPQSVTLGFLTIIIFLMSAVLITGISILSSGINTASIFLLFNMGGYVLIWLLLSSLAFPLFNGSSNAIPQPFGNLFFLLLTGMYTFGIFRRVT